MTPRQMFITVGALTAASFAAMPAIAQQSSTASLSKDYTETVQFDSDSNVDVNLSKEIDVSKDLSLSGLVSITGTIEVTESAMATVDNRQILDDNVVEASGNITNQAQVGTDVLLNATGRIGLNVAAGDNNAQDNATAMAAIGTAAAGAAGGSGDAEVFVYQELFNNDWTGANNQANHSELLGNVLMGASGDIGVNVASGAFNVQKNALTVASVTGSSVLAEAAAAVTQQSSFNSVSHNETQNIASLAGNVLNGASGNIGANIGAGTNNIQANSLSLATAQ